MKRDNKMDGLSWIGEWYESHCNGEWEEIYGVNIVTLDNPGWLIEIDVLETDLENKAFTVVDIDNSDDDWIRCEVKNGKFVGVGDKTKLSDIINIFKEWCHNAQNQ